METRKLKNPNMILSLVLLIIAAIACIINYILTHSYYIIGGIPFLLYVLLVFLSFIFLMKKDKVAIITTVLALLSSVYIFIAESTSIGAILPLVLRDGMPILLDILLIVYAVKPSAQKKKISVFISLMLFMISHIINACLNVFGDFRLSQLPTNNTYILFIALGLFLVDGINIAFSVQRNKEGSQILSSLDSLEKLAKLKEQGTITAEEFEAKKQELMNRM